MTTAPTGFAVLDVDGVLADVRHRLPHLERRPKDWEAFFAAAPADPPLAEGVELARRLSAAYRLVYLTGRPARLRRPTADWLTHHGLPEGRLLMRAHRDFRPARVTKLEFLRTLLREAPVHLVVDDDPDVVDAVRRAGFDVLLADWVERRPALHRAQERDGRT